MSEDITFCMNRECKHSQCKVNPTHIKVNNCKPYHSFAYYENTEVCIKSDGRCDSDLLRPNRLN